MEQDGGQGNGAPSPARAVRPPRAPGSLSGLNLEAHLRNPAIKQRYVTALFDTIAQRYDRFTRRFSFGMDRGWKRELVEAARSGVNARGVAIDLACGTGDLACGLAGGARVTVGMDASREMLQIAARRARGTCSGMRLSLADMMALPLRAGSTSVVTVGYGMRNVPSLAAALAEAHRVLQRDGWLYTLDFFRPAARWWRATFLAYLKVTGRLYGRLWHGNPDAYGYIAASIEQWMTPAAYEQRLEESGFSVQWVRRKLGGGVCLHGARRA